MQAQIFSLDLLHLNKTRSPHLSTAFALECYRMLAIGSRQNRGHWIEEQLEPDEDKQQVFERCKQAQLTKLLKYIDTPD